MPKSYKEHESLASLWEKATDDDSRAAMKDLQSGISVLSKQESRFENCAHTGLKWESQMQNLSRDIQAAKGKIATSLANLKARDVFTTDEDSLQLMNYIESHANET